MVPLFRHALWFLKGVTVFALVGRSGTGKSFRARLVAQKYSIDFIIDDGLLIRDQKIIAGRSAKREKAFLGAIKTALFDDMQHRQEVINALQKSKFKKILILGTSERMVRKIADRLCLPSPFKILNIEQLASEEEIQIAIRSRKAEGKHVIPVPTVEIHRNYPQMMYDSVKVFFKSNLVFPLKDRVFEKSVVRPEFANKGKITISEAALTQMVLHCLDEYDDTITVKKVTVKNDPNRGYRLRITIHIPFGLQLTGNIHNLQTYIIESLERYAGVLIDKVHIAVDHLT